MRATKAYLAVAMLLVAGCAGSPQVAEQAPAAAAPAAAVPAPAGELTAAVVPDAVLDIQEINASTAPPIICRELLKPNSNVHVRQCMTESDWKIYKRAEALRAEELTRMFQGKLYRR